MSRNNASVLQNQGGSRSPHLAAPRNLVPVFPGSLSWATLSSSAELLPSDLPPSTATHRYFSTDTTLTYEHFFADWGPLNMGQVVRFCKALEKVLEEEKGRRHVVYCTSEHQHRR